MATQHFSAPSSGAIHVRTRLSENFTILANRLAQRPGSAVTVGVALFINSMPDGTPITIEALREHFTEGEAVIGRALRELEDEGWFERRILRGPNGRFRTQTYVYTLPELAHPETARPPLLPPEPEAEPQPEPEPEAAEPTPTPVPAPTVPPAEPAPGTPAPPAAADPPAKPASPQAVSILTELGTRDPRLTLSHREIDRLAPGVDTWLTSGVQPARITSTLTTDLPTTFRTRPAAVLTWRLAELRPAPSPKPPAPAAPVEPMQNCEDCDHGFRSPAPGRCPFCEHERRHPAPPPNTDHAL